MIIINNDNNNNNILRGLSTRAVRSWYKMRGLLFCGRFYILQRVVQWKQGVVIYMTLYTSVLYDTTPIHCTPSHCTPL